MKGLDELRNPKEQNVLIDTITYRGKQFDIIEKELKALDIIQEKNVDIRGIKLTKDVHKYNLIFPTALNEFLEEQEYHLLSEVLK